MADKDPNGVQAENPAEDPGIYVICYVCNSLERWDRDKASSEPVLVTQKRAADREQYFRLANGERSFERMIESAISTGFGPAGMKEWLPHVVLVTGDGVVEVDPQSTPLKLDLRPNGA